MKVVSAGTNPVQLTRGMERTIDLLVEDLKSLSTEIKSDKDLLNVGSVSAGGNEAVGKLITDAMAKVCIRMVPYRQLYIGEWDYVQAHRRQKG